MYGLQSLQILVDAAQLAVTNCSFYSADLFAATNLTQLNQKEESVDGLHSLFSAGALDAAFRKVIGIETAKSVVVTAIALKRYQLKHGNYPADLKSLVPEFVPAVPLDPVDGQPLRYRRNADGTFLLYSVGENGVDDGGNPALEPGVTSSSFAWQNPHALDWVWPQPATAAEIQKYYEEQARRSKN